MASLSSHDYLNSFINYEVKPIPRQRAIFNLDRMHALLNRLGNPQERLKIIHVAGTKGKGSVSAMTAHILKEAGYRVGLYTSPHFNNWRERIRVLDDKKVFSPSGEDDIFPDMISEQELDSLVGELKTHIEPLRDNTSLGRLTFFEVFTALAFFYFDRCGTDFCVLETGLGGRLDATNALHSEVCAITPISFDHMHVLGDSLEKIATEKAGIIKHADTKVVLAPQTPEAGRVLKERCRFFNVIPVEVGVDIAWKPSWVDGVCYSHIVSRGKDYGPLRLGLRGNHQCANAAVAVAVVECLQEKGAKVSGQAVKRGLKNVFWPGRFEIIDGGPLLVLDCAHNDDSIAKLVETFAAVFADRRVSVVLGVSGDKDFGSIAKGLIPLADCVIMTKARHPRARLLTNEELRAAFPEKKCAVVEDMGRALAAAKKEIGSDGVVVVTGSVFLVSEIRNIIRTFNVVPNT